MTFDYYLQNDKSQSIRRYPSGEEKGERWDVKEQAWNKHCANRETCLATNDIKLTEEEAMNLIPTLSL